eukprot:g174.t1
MPPGTRGLMMVSVLVAVVQSFPDTAYMAWLTRLQLTQVELSVYGAVAFAPYYLKPLYGIVSDLLPIRGQRRRPYIMLASFFYGVVLLVQGTAVHSKAGAYGVSFVRSLCGAFLAMLTEAYLVDLMLQDGEHGQQPTQQRPRGLEADRSGGSSLSGGDLSTAELGSNSSSRAPVTMPSGKLRSTAHRLQSALQAAGAVGALSAAKREESDQEESDLEESNLEEDHTGSAPAAPAAPAAAPRGEQQSSLVRRFGRLLCRLKDSGALGAGLFLFLRNARPTASMQWDSFFYKLLSERDAMRLQTDEGIVNAVGRLVGAGLYATCFRRVAPVRAIVVTVVLSAVVSSSQLLLALGEDLGLGVFGFVCSDMFVVSVASEMALISTLVLATLHCPRNFAGAAFAIFSSLLDFGDAVGGWISAPIVGSLRVGVNVTGTAPSCDPPPL